MKTALVTRAVDDAPRLCEALHASGWTVRHLPLLQRVPAPELAQQLADAPPADVLLLTSPATAELVAAALTASPSCIAAVGPRTAAVARGAGLRVDVVPAVSDGAHLIEALGDLDQRVVLYPGAEKRTPSTGRALRAAGAIVHDLVAYTNIEPTHDTPTVLAALAGVSVAPLLSSSAAERLARVLRDHDLPPLPAVAIGPSTAETAKRVGLPLLATSEEATIASLVACCDRVIG